MYQIRARKKMTCKFCRGTCIKNGYQANGKQRYKCKHCHRKQQALYSYNAYQKGINDVIVIFRLKNCNSLIDTKIHRTSLYGTNHVERHNLTIRTHLKRLPVKPSVSAGVLLFCRQSYLRQSNR